MLELLTTEQTSLIGNSHDSVVVGKVIEFDNNLDKEFGLNIPKIEQTIPSERSDHYKGLDASALQTSYLDFYQIFNVIPQDALVVDVGAGYSRGTLLAQQLGRKCISIEVVEQRVKETQKILKNKSDIICADVTCDDFTMPEGDYYFLYLPHGEVLYQTLKKIQKLASLRTVNLIVIESHGNVVDYLDAQSHWLVKKDLGLKTSLPRHNNHIYFYECYGQDYPTIFEQHWDWNRDKDREYLVWRDEQLWTANTYQSELWVINHKIHLETFSPSKMISMEDLFSTRCISEQSEQYNFLYHARQNKVVTPKGHITKIFIRPRPMVEWLNGETCDWQSAISFISSLSTDSSM